MFLFTVWEHNQGAEGPGAWWGAWWSYWSFSLAEQLQGESVSIDQAWCVMAWTADPYGLGASGSGAAVVPWDGE